MSLSGEWKLSENLERKVYEKVKRETRVEIDIEMNAKNLKREGKAKRL